MSFFIGWLLLLGVSTTYAYGGAWDYRDVIAVDHVPHWQYVLDNFTLRLIFDHGQLNFSVQW